MASLSALAKKFNTGLLWENCHGTVAPGMIGAGNGCGGPAGCVAPATASSADARGSGGGQQCKDSRVALPAAPGDFNNSATFPAMITEDEQWFDYWGFGTCRHRSPPVPSPPPPHARSSLRLCFCLSILPPDHVLVRRYHAVSWRTKSCPAPVSRALPRTLQLRPQPD